MGRISSIKEKVKEAECKSRVLHYFLEKYRYISRYSYNARLQRMSRKETFQDIYKNDRWGYFRYKNAPCDFYSGPGSYAGELVNPYVSLVKKLISEKEIKTIADLGCGDFNVGSRIAPLVVDYTGCDIVPELIERNKKKFGNDRCSFVCLDIVEDDLPAADLCLIREVFQHLSNKEIMNVLHKLRQYKFVLVTETIKSIEEGFNKDIPHGSHRGICLKYPPFCMMGTEVLRLNHPVDKGYVVVSTLFKQPDPVKQD